MASNKHWSFQSIPIFCFLAFCHHYHPAGVYARTSQSASFDRRNFIVRFNPYVAPDDIGSSYDEHDLLPMIEKISTRFSKIFTFKLSEDDINDSFSFIATAVAKFNILHNDTLQIPLDVLLLYVPEESENSTHKTSSFKVVFDIAERANSIFPGTVGYLLVEHYNLRLSNADHVSATLKDARNEVEKNSTKHEYKLGALFPMSACGTGVNIRSYLTPLLSQLELVVFDLYPTKVDYDVGVEESFVGFTGQFQRCKDKVKTASPMLEVGFRTRWPDTDFKDKQNFSSLVFFWKKMNDWATTTSTKIFMEEAFDQPYLSLNRKHQGWWKLKSKRSYFGTDQYIYEDKMELMEAAIRTRENTLERTTIKIQPETSTFSPPPLLEKGGGSISSIVIISVVTSLLILAGTGALMFFLYKKVLRKMDSRQQNLLTKEDIQEFFNGTKTDQHFAEGLQIGEGVNKSLNIAYNKEYELPPTSFTADETSPLGMGTFGIVCRGKVFMQSKEVEVAVKMLKKACPTTALKGLLSEIKVMSYLGSHENVVSLIGAYTEELRKGKVYVFTELCCLGSLETYLREYKPRHSMTPGESTNTENSYLLLREDGIDTGSVEKGQKGQMDFKDLHRWSYEIATGMEFLASKHVVHADLATRNVLLTSDMSAKIADFGLSRRLYDYTNYVKSKQELLPFRYMSPESLRRLVFNEKTDVWAYGVTLWEIYSLGDVPYPGLSWSIDFATKLIKGLRLEEPQYNADSMYTVMLKCWNTDPVKRPNFAQLKKSLTR